MNREQWLTDLGKQLERFFAGVKLAPYKVSCSFPSHRAFSPRYRVVGQCFGAEVSKGQMHELFVSPLLDDPLEVAGTLCHEMVHVAAGVKANHGPGFVKVARFVGLTKGKPTTALPCDALAEKILKIIEKQGAYPHKAIVPSMRLREKKCTIAKLLCTACGCRMHISLKWLGESGLPTCGCGEPLGVVV